MRCTIENRGLFVENNIKEESGLKFQFSENHTVIKFENTKFYRDYFNKLSEEKVIDFISVDKDKIAFIEVKNCTGDEEIVSGELHRITKNVFCQCRRERQPGY